MENVNKYNDAQLEIKQEIQQSIGRENSKLNKDKKNIDELKRRENSKLNKDKKNIDELKKRYEKLLKGENKEPLNTISNSDEKSKIKKKEILNKLSKIRTDDIWLNKEIFLLKNTEILKNKPILISILEDVGIIKPEIFYYYDFSFDENGKELPTMEKLKKFERKLDKINDAYKRKITMLRGKLEKNFISDEDRNKQLSENYISNYFGNFKIKIEKYDDAIKYLNNLRFESVKEVELFEKNFGKEKNKDNINLKMVLIYLKTELKELLKKDAQNLEKLVNYFYDNYTFFRKNEKYDKELLRIREELINVYLKFVINSYEIFLYGLDKNKSNLNLNKVYEVKDKNKRKEKDIFEKIDKKLKEKIEHFKGFIPITGPDSRFF